MGRVSAVLALALVGLAVLLAFSQALAAGGQDEDAAGIPFPPVGPCIGSDDDYEENDSPDNAAPAKLPFNVDNLLSCEGDPDWFVFSAPAGAMIDITVEFANADGDIDLFLRDESTQVALATSVTDNEHILIEAPTSGRYFAGLSLINDANSFGNSYDIAIDIGCREANAVGGAFTDDLQEPYPVPSESSPLAVTDCFEVDSDETVQDLEVGLEISHTSIGDLVVSLEHVDTGTDVVLINRVGQPADLCSGIDIDVVFSDSADEDPDVACRGGPLGLSGVVRPEEPLTGFDGQSIAGIWRLQVTDVRPMGAAGTLNEWFIFSAGEEPTDTPTPTVAEGPTNTPTPTNQPATPTGTPTTPSAGLAGDVDCNGLVNAIDAAFILQRQAGLVAALPCPENADVNQDGNTTSVDAAIILQFTAGLVSQLPV